MSARLLGIGALRAAAILGALAVGAGPLHGQRLLSFGPQVEVLPSVDAIGTVSAILPQNAQIDLELLRSGPLRLEVPTPDGRLLVLERTVFEERGGGDVMWSGRFPGAAYDTVVLTIRDGSLVGRIAELGGSRFQISADPFGGGRMMTAAAASTALTPYLGIPGQDLEIPGQVVDDFCPVGRGLRDPRGLLRFEQIPRLSTLDPEQLQPGLVRAASSHSAILELLVLYTARAASNWTARGMTAQAAVQNAVDYLNMVLRNSDLDASATLVHTAQAPGHFNRVAGDGLDLYEQDLFWQLHFNSGEVQQLRTDHGTDIVHLFSGEPGRLLGWCGVAYAPEAGDTEDDFAYKAIGVTSNNCGKDEAEVFAHEVGHNLGAHHNPEAAQTVTNPVQPYAFGHYDLDGWPAVGTIMSYIGDPQPIFSTIDVTPGGRGMGIRNERENARALEGTVDIADVYDSGLPSYANAPDAPGGFQATNSGSTSVTLTWEDNSSNETGFELGWSNATSNTWPWPFGTVAANSQAASLTSLSSTARYFLYVAAYRTISGEKFYSPESYTTIVMPGAKPTAPSGLAATCCSNGILALTWTDNSNNEKGFEIHVLRDGAVLYKLPVPEDTQSASYNSSFFHGDLSFRVYSWNNAVIRRAYSASSNTATLSIAATTAPTNLRASPSGPNSVRLTWTDNSNNETGFYVGAYTLGGWSYRFQLAANTESAEVNGLAPGVGYYFVVRANDSYGLASNPATIVLGTLGSGPMAPSALAYTSTGASSGRLAWTDSSSNETGFEVLKSSFTDFGRPERLGLVGAGTTTFDVSAHASDNTYRVISYNASGASPSKALYFDIGLEIIELYTSSDQEVSLSSDFVWDTSTYTATVAHIVSNVSLYFWQYSDGGSSVTVNGTSAAPATAIPIALPNTGSTTNDISVVVTAPDGVTTSTYTFQVTRQADTSKPKITLLLAPSTIDEDPAGTIRSTVTATLAAPATSQFQFEISTSGLGHTLSSNKKLRFNQGATTSTRNVRITAVNDSTASDDRIVTVSATLGNNKPATAPDSVYLLIREDEPASPTVNLVLTPSAIDEDPNGANSSTVSATLSGPAPADFTVTVSSSGSGHSLSANPVLSFARYATTSTGTVTISATNDSVYTANRTVTVSGTLSTGASATAPGDVQLTITEDEPAPRIALALSSATIDEAASGTNSSTVTATLPTAALEAFDLTVQTSGASHALSTNRVLHFAKDATASTGTVTISAVDDSDYTGNRAVTVWGIPTWAAPASASYTVTLTVADDDTPTVTLVLTPSSIDENPSGTNSSVVTATLAQASVSAFTVTVSTSGTGHTLSSNPVLSFAENATASTGTVTITAANDDSYTGDDTVTVSGALSNGAPAQAPNDATLTITEDDPLPKVALVLATNPINESGAGNSTAVTATLPSAAVSAFTVTVSTSGSGHTLSSNPVLSFAENATASTGTVTITAANDDSYTGDGTVTVSGALSNGAPAQAPDDATLTITEDESAPKVALVLATNPINESGGNSTAVTATLPSAAVSAFTVTISTSGSGHTLSSNPVLSFAENATASTGTVTITAANDDSYTGDDTVTVSGALSSGAPAQAPDDATLTITDDEPLPKVALVLATNPIAESGDGNSTTVTATLPSAAVSAFTVTVSTSGTGHTLSADPVLSFAENATSSTGTVTITAANDDSYTGDDTVTVSGALSDSAPAQAPDDVTLTITDDEPAPKVALVLATNPIAESGDGNSTTVTATLPSAAVSAFAVTVSASGAGHTLSANPVLSFAENATSSTGTVTITATNDDSYTGDGTVTVSGALSDSAPAQAPDDLTLTITDDDSAPKVALVLATNPIAESGDGNSTTVTATLPLAAVSAFTVTVSTSGTGHALSANPVLSFAQNATSSTGTVTITATNNDSYTGDDTVTVSGAVSDSAPAQAPDDLTLTITDDDSAPKVALVLATNPIAERGDGNSTTVTATLPLAAISAFTVTISTSGSGHTLSSNPVLSFAQNATASTGTVTITAANDDSYTGDDTVTVSGALSNGAPAQAPDDATLTITEDESAPNPKSSSNADLSGLALADTGGQGVTLSPAFSATVATYSASVSNAVGSVTVTPTAADSGASIRVNNVPLASGSTSGSIALLNTGSTANTIAVFVAAADRVTTKTYTIQVTRQEASPPPPPPPEPDSNANLAGLALAAADGQAVPLSPAFRGAVAAYSARVAAAIDSVTVTPTVENPEARVTVNGGPVSSGAPSEMIELSYSGSLPNEIRVVVTAGDGRTMKTYRVHVTREMEPPEAHPTETLTAWPRDSGTVLTWGGQWADPSLGTLVIEARSQESGSFVAATAQVEGRSQESGWFVVATALAGERRAEIHSLENSVPYSFRLAAEMEDGEHRYSEEENAMIGLIGGPCRNDEQHLCLQNGRFEVQTHWANPYVSGDSGLATAARVDHSDESGLFWFFEPSNIELVIKVLDGRWWNDNYWVFFGALSDVEYWISVRDVVTGSQRTYHNPPKEVCGQRDLSTFPGASANDSTAAGPASKLPPGAAGLELLEMQLAPLDSTSLFERKRIANLASQSDGGGRCEPSENRLCLLDDRFSVEVRFVDPNDDPAEAEKFAKVAASPRTENTGFLWLFNPENLELAVKLLDGRALNGKFWFLYGGLSDVEYTITVTDTATATSKTYTNEAGSMCGQIDIDALLPE